MNDFSSEVSDASFSVAATDKLLLLLSLLLLLFFAAAAAVLALGMLKSAWVIRSTASRMIGEPAPAADPDPTCVLRSEGGGGGSGGRGRVGMKGKVWHVTCPLTNIQTI